MTGKLTQQMRTAAQVIGGKDIKSVLNSIIAAVDMSKVEDGDKNDIISKIQGSGADNSDLQEDDVLNQVEDSTLEILNDPTAKRAVEMAGLDHQSDPNLGYDFAEAAYIYTMDYNQDIDFINHLNRLLRSNDFKPSQMLKDSSDLSQEGALIYDMLVQIGEEYHPVNENKLSMFDIIKNKNK